MGNERFREEGVHRGHSRHGMHAPSRFGTDGVYLSTK